MAEVKNEEVFPPSNSRDAGKASRTNEDKEEFVRREKVISGKVIQRKRGLFSKAAESIKGEDAQTVGEYLVMDVVVPAMKRTISDVVSQGIDRLLFGESRPRNANTRGYTSYSTGATRASYLNEARPGNLPRRDLSRRARATHDFDEIILETRSEAEAVVEQLSNFMDQYEVVSVADLYDVVGVTGNYMDRKWGWHNLSDMAIRRVREGYLIDMPPTIELR